MSLGAWAQMRPFDTHTEQTNPDYMFQQAALYITGTPEYRAVTPNPFLEITDLAAFAGRWEYISTVYVGDEYLFYVGDIHAQACVPNQTVHPNEQRWAKVIQDSDCHSDARFIDLFDTHWTKDGCAVLKANPSRKVCLFLDPINFRHIDHIRLYEQHLL